MTRWKTKDGKVLKLSEMSDKHLKNSLAYAEERRDYLSLEMLRKEKSRRTLSELEARIETCPFCKGEMRYKKFVIEPPVDGGFQFPKKYFRFVCTTCEAMGPKEDFPSSLLQ